jgi:uncharacterized protein YcaQ
VLEHIPAHAKFDKEAREQLLDIFREAADYWSDRKVAFRCFYSFSVARVPSAEKAGVAAEGIELLEEGELRTVAVDGWTENAFVHRSTKLPKQLHATALLSPFDSLVWCRPRNERLFNFHYRIEIYTPKEKRKFGYYVLPFMMNGEMVGRVDLKADRANNTLLVHGIHTEKGFRRATIDDALNNELRAMASWLQLNKQ